MLETPDRLRQQQCPARYVASNNLRLLFVPLPLCAFALKSSLCPQRLRRLRLPHPPCRVQPCPQARNAN